MTYFEVGKLLNEAGSHYGYDVVGEYSKKLVMDVGKKFDKKTLYRMKQFYNKFSDEKVAPVERQLTWSHYKILLPINDENKMNYYINQIEKRKLTKRELENIIKSMEYERLDDNTKMKLINNEKLEVKDIIPNPIIIPVKSNDIKSEKELKLEILDNISFFLKQLGNGFTFVDSEYKIKIGEHYNYIDLLLFNVEYDCYVVVELKITELKKEHIGQIEVHMNYIDTHIKKVYHDKTIGIIICKVNNKYIIEYISDKRIISRTYELVNSK